MKFFQVQLCALVVLTLFACPMRVLAKGDSDSAAIVSSGKSTTTYTFYQIAATGQATALDMVIDKFSAHSCSATKPFPPYDSDESYTTPGSNIEVRWTTHLTFSQYNYTDINSENALDKCLEDIRKLNDDDPIIQQQMKWSHDMPILSDLVDDFAAELIAAGKKYDGSGTLNNLLSWSPMNSYLGCSGQADAMLNKTCSLTVLQGNYEYKVVQKGAFESVPGYPEAPNLAHYFMVVYAHETWGPVFILDSWNGKNGTFKNLGGADKAAFRKKYLSN